MALKTKLWTVETNRPNEVEPERLDLEERLEDWLKQDIGLLSNNLLVIGSQIHKYGGILDLLAVNSMGHLVVIELKREKTPRDVVAQVLDYASWVNELDRDDVEEIAKNHLSGQSFEDAFRKTFESEPPEVVNERQHVYIVASSLDASTQRIVEYLSTSHGVDINAATFSYFKIADKEVIARSMLLDDEKVVSQRQRARRKATNRQSVGIEEGYLVIEYQNGSKESWKLPEQADKEAIGQIWEKAKAFARENEATDGQLGHIGNVMRRNGYRMQS